MNDTSTRILQAANHYLTWHSQVGCSLLRAEMTQGYRTDDMHHYDNDTSFRRQRTLVIAKSREEILVLHCALHGPPRLTWFCFLSPSHSAATRILHPLPRPILLNPVPNPIQIAMLQVRVSSGHNLQVQIMPPYLANTVMYLC